MGLGFVIRFENLSKPYDKTIMTKMSVQKPPTIVVIFSFPFMLKVGKGEPKASMFLKTSSVVIHFLFFTYYCLSAEPCIFELYFSFYQL